MSLNPLLGAFVAADGIKNAATDVSGHYGLQARPSRGWIVVFTQF